MSRRRSAFWAVALAATAFALPAAADGADETPWLDAGVARYMGIARTFWGGSVPTCVLNGETVVPAHAVLFDDPDPEVAARGEQPGCVLWIDRGTWPTLSRVEACTVVVHEWGHMLGLGHSADRADVMAEYPRHAPGPCAALVRRRRHPAAGAAHARRCVRPRRVARGRSFACARRVR
jgi:hypothetical protein